MAHSSGMSGSISSSRLSPFTVSLMDTLKRPRVCCDELSCRCTQMRDLASGNRGGLGTEARRDIVGDRCDLCIGSPRAECRHAAWGTAQLHLDDVHGGRIV